LGEPPGSPKPRSRVRLGGRALAPPSAKTRGGFSPASGIEGGGGPVDTQSGMNGRRGTTLLLAHCHALAQLDEVRVPAYERLELALGSELARLLTGALAARGGLRA
jgi:hypothetical protein